MEVRSFMDELTVPSARRARHQAGRHFIEASASSPGTCYSQDG